MTKTKIEWCDATWNPISGCYNKCEYCYARRIIKRFKGGGYTKDGRQLIGDGTIRDVEDVSAPIYRKTKAGKFVKAAYPYGITPTLHRYALDKPRHWREPRTIFVGDMADVFGEWVPDEWIQAVFDACNAAPQHCYLFLTKNPKRYYQLAEGGKLPPEHWYGTTISYSTGLIFGSRHYRDRQLERYESHSRAFEGPKWGDFKTFVSLEPMYSADYCLDIREQVNVIIMGAETGEGAGKRLPTKNMVCLNAYKANDNSGLVFMKNSLIPVVGEENMRRELPWNVKK